MSLFNYTLIFLLIIICSHLKGSHIVDSVLNRHSLHPNTSYTTNINSNNEEVRGFEVIGNFGGYYADKRHAAFYNGMPHNENNINFVLGNKYWSDAIKEKMRTTINRDSFLLSNNSYPQNMKYSIAMYVGFGLRYNYSANWALNIQFNACRLTTKDFFTLEIFPAFDNESKSFVNYGIVGTESRTKIDIGMVKTFLNKNNIRPTLEFGINFNNTLVRENFIEIEGEKFSTIDIYANRQYIPNTNVQEYEVRQGGLGVGGYGGGGIKWVLNSYFSIETIVYVYSTQINLERYESFGNHISCIFRIVASPALFINKQ